jgi:hypothetical protein
LPADNYYISASCVISDRTVYKDEKLIFEHRQGDSAQFMLSFYQHLGSNYPKFYKMDNLSRLGWLAAEVLLSDFNREQYQAHEIGVVLCNANSSLDTDLRYFETTAGIPSPSLFVYTLPNILIGEICIRHHFKGENAFFVFEKFDLNFIEQYVNNLVINNILQACICGWVELLGENHEAVLFLVEKNQPTQSTEFSAENMKKIYQAHHG